MKEKVLIDDYESGEILLSTAKSEYENERNRTIILDSKTNIVLTFSSVMLVALTQIINIKKITNIKITKFIDIIVPSILCLTIISSLILLLIAIILFGKVIFTKEYKTIDALYFYDVNKIKYKKGLFSTALSQFYIEATFQNKNTNDSRVKEYKTGLGLMAISIFSFVVYSIISSAI